MLDTHLRWGRRAAVGAILTVGSALVAAPALAASPNGQTVTQTYTQHGTWTEQGDTDFCSGATIAPTITGNSVEHVTYFTNSDEAWGTFTTTGTATAVVPDPTLGYDLTYSGRITIWGNFNQNERNANSTFTASFDLTATDQNGVVHTEVGHEVAHVGWNAVSDTPVVNFDKMYVTCS